MSAALLQIRNLSVSVEGNEILHDISLDVHKGETHVLMGPNGAGKSTIGNTLMGNPQYHVTSGSILFDGQELNGLSPDKRAKAGMFMSFQNPIEVPGLSLESFIRNAIRQQTGKPIRIFQFKKRLEDTMRLLNMDPAYADRDLNVGFSGGEKKKAEILQMLMLDTKLCILDETDSGLDVDAVHTVSNGIKEYQKNSEGALMIITHNAKILESLKVDRTHVIVRGHLVADGGPELIEKISEHGFEEYIAEAADINE